MVGIVFYDEVSKSINSRAEALRALRAFLNKKEPELVYLLQNVWRLQGKAITYKELREAILSGYIDQGILDEWQQDYARFVTLYLQPMYIEAMEAAVKKLSRKYPLFAFDPMAEGVKKWTDIAGAKFVTNSTNEQIAAVRHVVSRAAQLHDMNVDHLSRAIRAMVGLTRPQARANLNYYTKMIQSGMPEKKALERSIRYSARQSRYRGYMIARTELAFAYNKGEQIGVVEAVNQGMMGETVKVWCTADDERVCEICGGLEGKTVALTDGFNFPTRLRATEPTIDQTPPAHPHCRCAVLYREISPPSF